jgi:hypothetical protein
MPCAAVSDTMACLLGQGIFEENNRLHGDRAKEIVSRPIRGIAKIGYALIEFVEYQVAPFGLRFPCYIAF